MASNPVSSSARAKYFKEPAAQPKALDKALSQADKAPSSQAKASRPAGVAPAKQPKASPAAKPAMAQQPTLKQSKARLAAFEKQYTAKADGKAAVQKIGDSLGQLFGRDRDAQFTNIRKTREQLVALERSAGQGPMSKADAAKLATIDKRFKAQEARVTAQQKSDAEFGKGLQAGGRVAVMGITGVAATVASGGNVFVGMAAASGAGMVYDMATVAGEGKSDLAPKHDVSNSLGGAVGRTIKGNKLNGGDWARAAAGSGMDALNGGFAGRGVMVARAAQMAVQGGGRMAMAKAAVVASTKNSLWQTAASTGAKTLSIAGDLSQTPQDNLRRAADNAGNTLQQLPTQLATNALSTGLGVGAQINGSRLLDAGVQISTNAALNLAPTAIGNAINGRGFTVSREELGSALGQGLGDAYQGMQARVPQRSARDVLRQVEGSNASPAQGNTVTTAQMGELQKALTLTSSQALAVHKAMAMTLTPEAAARSMAGAAALQQQGKITAAMTGPEKADEGGAPSVDATGRSEDALNPADEATVRQLMTKAVTLHGVYAGFKARIDELSQWLSAHHAEQGKDLHHGLQRAMEQATEPSVPNLAPWADNTSPKVRFDTFNSNVVSRFIDEPIRNNAGDTQFESFGDYAERSGILAEARESSPPLVPSTSQSRHERLLGELYAARANAKDKASEEGVRTPVPWVATLPKQVRAFFDVIDTATAQGQPATLQLARDMTVRRLPPSVDFSDLFAQPVSRRGDMLYLQTYQPVGMDGRNATYDSQRVVAFKSVGSQGFQEAVQHYANRLQALLPLENARPAKGSGKPTVVLTAVPSSTPGKTSNMERLLVEMRQRGYAVKTMIVNPFTREKTTADNGDRDMGRHLDLALRERPNPKQVYLLLDDVITSGNSMAAAKALMEQYGATTVIPLGLALTTRLGPPPDFFRSTSSAKGMPVGLLDSRQKSQLVSDPAYAKQWQQRTAAILREVEQRLQAVPSQISQETKALLSGYPDLLDRLQARDVRTPDLTTAQRQAMATWFANNRKSPDKNVGGHMDNAAKKLGFDNSVALRNHLETLNPLGNIESKPAALSKATNDVLAPYPRLLERWVSRSGKSNDLTERQRVALSIWLDNGFTTPSYGTETRGLNRLEVDSAVRAASEKIGFERVTDMRDFLRGGS